MTFRDIVIIIHKFFPSTESGVNNIVNIPLQELWLERCLLCHDGLSITVVVECSVSIAFSRVDVSTNRLLFP